jgi:nitric oxide reductase NorE protein
MSGALRPFPEFLEPPGHATRGPATGAVGDATTGEAPPTPRAPFGARRWVPGEAGLWVFLLGDMTMFGAFFTAFLVQRGQDEATFAASREALTVPVGAINTIVLLTSSLLVALAVRAHREGARDRSRRLVAGAGAFGALFGVIKVAEWATKAADGHHPASDLFFTYYYLLTGVHFLHLLIGGVVLAFWYRRLGAAARENEPAVVEGCASYWHMVDLLWVVIFPVLYLSAT